MQSQDQDFRYLCPAFSVIDRLHELWNRYMGLSDLMKEIKLDPQSFLGDESVEIKVLGQVLQLVEDKISEVKNQAVKWCGMSLPIKFG
jgi:hypothetical protein